MGRTKCSQRGEVTMDEGSLVTETACQIGVTHETFYRRHRVLWSHEGSNPLACLIRIRRESSSLLRP